MCRIKRIALWIAGAAALAPAPALAQTPPAPAEAKAPAVATVAAIDGIGPVGEWRKLGGGYLLSEGPLGASDGTVYFTDYRGGFIYRIDPATQQISPFLSGLNAGGLAFSPSGQLLVAEGKQGKILQVDVATRKITTFADGIDGKRFNAPNDLTVDAQGGVYFTDPSNGATLPLVQGKQSVYYVSPKGAATRVVDYLPAPNGIVLSQDGKNLYVGLSSESEILGYHVLGPGRISPSSFVFGRVAYTPPTKRGEGARTGVDGMAVDAKGDVYVASKFGVQVFDPAGKSLGTIATPERPSNLKFGGKDGRTLYMTTYDSIFSVPMAVAGARRTGR
jgi:gluconolactonase